MSKRNAVAGALGGIRWLIVPVGLVLTARISVEYNERIAIGVGVASPLLAGLIGFSISGLDPTMVLTDLDLYSCLI